MITRKFTFREIFIAIAVLLVANIVVNLFIAGKPVKDYNVQAEYPMDSEMAAEHDGYCPCDGHDPNCQLTPVNYRLVNELIRDFQIEVTAEGDYIIYDGETPISVVTRDGKCNFKEIMVKYMNDND